MKARTGDSQSDARPKLTKNIPIADLGNYYWLKSELVDFCIKYGLPTGGRKLEILARIEAFLQSGEIIKPNVVILGAKPDSAKGKSARSDEPLTLDTPVVNFKSDQRTREFFKSVIGPHFHFTAYLNDFMRGRDDLTYGDLVHEWLAEYERRKDRNYKPPIMKSCEYNQFVRDFFADARNQGKPLREAVAAWNEVKTKHGPRKYSPAPSDEITAQ